ncbi:hypothetical protein [Rubricoccus marinus]|uniref:Uncharacterized protein n=1 Tax=Rubricoccus marinus TaxID=716817 RepID=A0A259TXJ5_9BACT|nr:hypothetical protein [Rubricoccus marinus]OZC02416.1 hypothetical protein BSZ36_05150 [Rubricoccus marinus]
MYDRVNLTIYVEEPKRLRQRLPPLDETHSAERGTFAYAGYVCGLRLSLHGHNLRVRGSLPGFIGAGFPPATVATVARQRLEEMLGMDMGAARVSRLEVYADLPLAHPPAAYLPSYLALSRHEPSRYPGKSVTFVTAKRTAILYDRFVKTGRDVDRGIARFEVRHMKGGVPLLFGRVTTLADLALPAFRRTAADEWERQYHAIEKARALAPLAETKDYARWHLLHGYIARGLDTVLDEIYGFRVSGTLGKSQTAEMRRSVLALVNDPRLTAPCPLLAEADALIRESADRMRA